MIGRIRDGAARALLPAFLFSLALLLIPFEHDASGVTCMTWAAERESRSLGTVDAEVAGRIDTLQSRVVAASRTASDHFDWLFIFLCAANGAYLLFSREKFSVRLAVAEGVMLTALVMPFATGSIC